MSTLEIKDLHVEIEGKEILKGVSLKVLEGDILGFIGPNGAGKTTVFNMLTKVYQPSRGEIKLAGVSTGKMDTVEVNKAGIARTFQNIRLFTNMSVIDNVKLGMHNAITYSTLSAIFRTPSFKKQEKEADGKAMELLKIFSLDDVADLKAGNLPYGAQRRLEIARALATSPKLLLLDEPAAGMNPQETEELMNTIRFIRDHFNISILLIEHDMKLVMGICERITVLNYGMMLASGTPSEIQNNPQVVKAYLGE